MAVKKKSECKWCMGLGLHADYWKIGWRRPMEMGVNGKPRFPKEKTVPCDRCGEPSEK